MKTAIAGNTQATGNTALVQVLAPGQVKIVPVADEIKMRTKASAYARLYGYHSLRHFRLAAMQALISMSENAGNPVKSQNN